MRARAQFVFCQRLNSGSFEYDNDLPARRRTPVIRREFHHRSATNFFELFRQLPGHHCPSRPGPEIHELVERHRHAIRCLVQYARVLEAAELSERLVALTSLAREKAEECEAVAGDRGTYEGGEHGG